MSIVRCEFCNTNIDTDFDVEHFVNDDMTKCIKQEERDEEEKEIIMKHTKGNWTIKDYVDRSNRKDIVGGFKIKCGKKVIAECNPYGGKSWEGLRKTEANAKLIAAAPDLLEVNETNLDLLSLLLEWHKSNALALHNANISNYPLIAIEKIIQLNKKVIKKATK